MARLWKQNEEKSEDEELVVTGHRDGDEPEVAPAEEQAVEVTHDDPREALDELGEDVGSSPARRGHEDPELASEQLSDPSQVSEPPQGSQKAEG